MIRWYEEVAALGQQCVDRGGHEEQNLYTSCRLLLCTRRSFTPPHPVATKIPPAQSSGHGGEYKFRFLFKQDDVSECIQMLKDTVDPLRGPGGEKYFRPTGEVGYPFAYGNNVYVAPPPHFSTGADKTFPLSTDRSRALKIAGCKQQLQKERFSSNEDATQRKERVAKVLESYAAQFKGHETPKGDTLKSGPDALTGLLTQMVSSAVGPSAEAIAPVAVFRGLLTYHAPAAVVIAFKFLNDAKGKNLFALDIALAAEWKRVLGDSTMPWEECLKRLRWLGIAMDNLAIARQLLGFTKIHGARHREWEELGKEDLVMLLETALTGRNTRLLQERITKAKKDGRQILPLAVKHNRVQIKVQASDKARIQRNCLDIAKHHRLSEEDFKAYLCLDGEICPFHVLSHEELQQRGYDIQMLRAILEDSRFHAECNRVAVGLDIHELDIDKHWDRLLYPVIHETCQLVQDAIQEVKRRHPSLEPRSGAFINEVKWRTVDRHGFPRLPYQSHAFGYVLAKRGPPNTAMFSGLQGGLPTVGEVRHADDYHHVHSYRDDLRTMCCEARVSNEIEKSSIPTLWEIQFNIHMMVPVDGAYWKTNRALGNQRLDRNDSPPDTTPPDPSYRDLELDEPPTGQLLSGQEGPLTFTCPSEGCNVEGIHAGEYQLHLNQRHSTWGQECGKCGRHFPDVTTMEAHKALNSCLEDDAVDDAVGFFEEHLSCREDGCSQKCGKITNLLSHEETHKAVEERKLPRFLCVCGCYWTDDLKEIARHQKSKRHENAMAAKGENSPGTRWKGLPKADQIRCEFYSGLEQSLFQTITEDQISQRGSSSGPGAEGEFGKWLTKKERSVERTIRRREEAGKYKGKKHCKRCFVLLEIEQQRTSHLASQSHKIATGTFTFTDWRQANESNPRAGYCPDCEEHFMDLNVHKKTKKHRNRVAKNAEATEDPLGAIIQKLKDDVLERIQAPPNATKGQHQCNTCLKLIKGKNDHLKDHQNTKGCKETGDILKSIDADMETAHEKIRERLANQPTQAQSTQPRSSSTTEADDAGDGGSGPGPSTAMARKRRQREEDAETAGRPSKRRRSARGSPGSPGSTAGGDNDDEADAMDVDVSASSNVSTLSIRLRRARQEDTDGMDFVDGDGKGKGKARG